MTSHRLLLPMLASTLMAQSCGGTDFKSKPGGQVASNGAEPGVKSPHAERDQVADDLVILKRLCTSEGAKKRTVTQQVRFPRTTGTCPFAKATSLADEVPDAQGNLAPLIEDRISARRVESFKLDVPKSATVCELKFLSPGQSNLDSAFTYNDEIFLTFNDAILLSSKNYNERMKNEAAGGFDFHKFVWKEGNLGIAGLTGYRPSTSDEVYCLGGPGKCSLPASASNNDQQVAAPLRIELPLDMVYVMSLKARNEQRYEFQLLTIGDNNASGEQVDCTHSDLAFDVAMEFVE